MTDLGSRTSAATLGELTGDYVLDPSRSRIGFVARQALVATVHGRFADVDGAAHLDGDHPSRSTTRVTVQAASLRTGNRRRDDHVCTHFLDSAHHPTITFASTRVERTAETSFTLTGDLTIRGRTRPISVPVELTGVEEDSGGRTRVGLAGALAVDRRDWGVRWNAAVEGGGLFVGPSVTLEFEVTVVRQRTPVPGTTT